MAIFDGFFSKDLRDLAMKKVKYAQKRYEEAEDETEKTATYFVILVGMGAGKLAFCPGDPHRYDMIIDAIHKYQKRHPNKNIIDGYTKAILTAIQGVSAKVGIETILSWLDYDIKKQNNGTSAFSLDYRMLLEKLKATVAERIDIFRAETRGFDMWFEERIEQTKQKDRRAR